MCTLGRCNVFFIISFLHQFHTFDDDRNYSKQNSLGVSTVEVFVSNERKIHADVELISLLILLLDFPMPMKC